MHAAAIRFLHHLLVAVGVVAAALPLPARLPAAEPLPWQPDYAAAVARAQAKHQHVVVMLAAPNSEACRRFETETLTAPLIRKALADMVWVRVVGDEDLERQFDIREHPTLAFVNPFTGGVLHRTSGEKTVELLAREIVHARRAIGAELTDGLEDVAGRMFSFDGERAEQLIESGDMKAVSQLLAPAAADDSRQANYLIAHVTLPEGLTTDDARFLVGSDCLIGSDTIADVPDPAFVAGRVPDLWDTCSEYPLPSSGLVLVPCERSGTAEVSVRITAPGCRLLAETIRFEGPAPGSAVQVRRYDLRPLDDADASRLSGRVVKPDGTPAAAAIVRIDEWLAARVGEQAAATPTVVRTDADGRFTFATVSPGRWLVRAEFPGGECEQFVSLDPAGHASCDLKLKAVTTVGLRWVLQSRERVQDLTGRDAQTGEAFVSVASSRISLARGMRIRTNSYGDLMFAQTPLADDSLSEETRSVLGGLPAGTPVWYLVDAAYTDDFQPLSGLHRDPRPFADIDTVRPGTPLPDQEWAIIGPLLPEKLAAARERGTYFQFPNGEPVRQGDVFTLRCTTSNCFAKIEVTDVTIVTPGSR